MGKQKLSKFQRKQRYTGREGKTLQIGMRGILLTCDGNRFHEAVREAISMLEQTADKLYPAVEASPEPDGEKSLADELAAELAALKEKPEKRRFEEIQLNLDSTSLRFVKFNRSTFNPNVMLLDIFDSIKQSGQGRSRFIQRVTPVSVVTAPEIDNVVAGVKEACKDYLGANDLPTDYQVIFKSQWCDKLQQDAVLDAISSAMPPAHRVVKSRRFSCAIFVHALKSKVCIGCGPKFNEYSSYNLRQLADPEALDRKHGTRVATVPQQPLPAAPVVGIASAETSVTAAAAAAAETLSPGREKRKREDEPEPEAADQLPAHVSGTTSEI
eukprot:TRINITY_DN6154_c0_g1_i3.p1 TRINITY_DN6154_c0_g1~~TRINITY_DN6154_c0_g1_i3.p1  ORF type:complete len:337 (+),score=57.39 TRINITY_DN6154_c0_g1_i3:32-1012(+)